MNFEPSISRVVRSRRAARAAYDRLSSWYDLLAGSEKAFATRALTKLDVHPGERVLEIGFGTGHALQALASCGSHVAGVDLSFGMARSAYRRLSKSCLQSKVLLSLGDGVQLPFPASRFDAVFLSFTLELFDTQEIPVVLHEIWRVLRDGGRVGVVALSLPEQPGMMVQIYEWFHKVLPVFVDCRPIPLAWYLQDNGFELNQVECAVMWGLPVEIVVGGKKGSV